MFEKLLTGFGYWQPLPALLSNVLILLLLVMIFFLLRFFFPNTPSRQRAGENLVANWEESIHWVDEGAAKTGTHSLFSFAESAESADNEDFGTHGRRFCLLLLVFICAVFWG